MWIDVYVTILFDSLNHFICVAILPDQILIVTISPLETWLGTWAREAQKWPVALTSHKNGSQTPGSNMLTFRIPSPSPLHTFQHCSGLERREAVGEYYNCFWGTFWCPGKALPPTPSGRVQDSGCHTASEFKQFLSSRLMSPEDWISPYDTPSSITTWFTKKRSI